MDNRTATELRDILRSRGLPVSGKKGDLLGRLAESVSPAKGDESPKQYEAESIELLVAGDDYIDFKKHVFCELAALHNRIENLIIPRESTSPTTADLLAEIESLRRQLREKDGLIKALAENAQPTAAITPSQEAWTTIPARHTSTGTRKSPPRNSWDPTVLCTPNRFAMPPSHDESRADGPTGFTSDTPSPPSQVATPSQPTQPTRPLVVVNPYPERQTGMRVVPGEKMYSEAHARSVMILTDSICGGVKRPDFIHDLRSRGIDVGVSIHRHTGGQSHQLHHYAQLHVADENPHGLLLVGGTNDLPRREGRRQLTDDEIVNNLIATGQFAKSQGVKNVFISSIICRKGVYYEKRRRAINRILEQRCIDNHFIFINNANILLEHTDGLHLTDEGTAILKSNFINSLY